MTAITATSTPKTAPKTKVAPVKKAPVQKTLADMKAASKAKVAATNLAARPHTAGPEKQHAAPKAASAKVTAPPKAQKSQATIKSSAPARVVINGIDMATTYGTGKPDTLPEAYRNLSSKDRLTKISSEEETTKLTWRQIAAYYAWSVTPWIDELVAEGVWPMKQDSKGKMVRVSYKDVYKSEKEQGVVGIGHRINTASSRFGDCKPEELKRAANKSEAKPPVKRDLSEVKAAQRSNDTLSRCKSLVMALTAEEVEQLLADPQVQDKLGIDPKLLK